jgi:energy-coupling factor transporter ATP-binding protein EcfA2
MRFDCCHLCDFTSDLLANTPFPPKLPPMLHWKCIHIERFRRLRNLCLDDLGSVNILVGKNNSGKTSVLEALAVMSDPFSPFNWINTAWERELKSARTPVLEVLNWMFPHTEPRNNGYEGAAVIEATFPSGETLLMEAGYQEFRDLALRSESSESFDLESSGVDDEGPSEYAGRLQIALTRRKNLEQASAVEKVTHEIRGGKIHMEVEKPVLLPHQFVSPVSHRTSRQLLAAVDQVLEERLKDDVVKLMQMLAKDVDDIEIRSPQGRGAVVQLHHHGIGHVPLSMEGDGMRRALAFASSAALAKNGILLLDEVETALHPDALGRIFHFLVQVCRTSGIQLFVSTHSLEAVDAMLESVGEEVDDLVVYHLPPRDSAQTVYRLGGHSIRSMRSDGGLDLR